jgi:hypothetical protein
MTYQKANRAVILVLPLSLLGSLACNWGGPNSSQTPIQTSSTAALPVDNRSPQSRTVPVSGSPAFTDEDFARHVEKVDLRLRKKLGITDATASHGFAVIVQKPFVVIGDESPRIVQQRAQDTVKWAVDHLKQDFFTKDPEAILEVWLFQDEASYNQNTKLLFGDTPTTPFGYYSPTHKALIMNIGTGGGTLVHEIVHPFIETNFPACPAWLNEGLGSLYEQCGEEDGHIHGYTNWRLPGLQRAIKAGTVPSFKTLTSMSSGAFYNEDKGTNYAQARYLCYYLQQKGLLTKFYKEFYSRQKDDATGYDSLQKVLGEADMELFKKKWEKFVLALRQGYEVTVE